MSDARDMKQNQELVPLLVVRGAARAIDYYVQVLGATVLERYEHGPEKHVSHAEERCHPLVQCQTEGIDFSRKLEAKSRFACANGAHDEVDVPGARISHTGRSIRGLQRARHFA